MTHLKALLIPYLTTLQLTKSFNCPNLKDAHTQSPSPSTAPPKKLNNSVHSRNCIKKLIKIISKQIDYNFTYCLAYRFNTKKIVKLNLK